MKESLVEAPRISIVTPSFNQGEFLEECIDSVLSQNYPDLEYIIMDGGSTDDSVQIIKRYEKYLTFWRSGPDGGQYQAINDGFRKTTGQIMAWMNSDDKYHHHAFFKVACLFSMHREVEWITGRPTIWNRDGSVEHVLCEYLPTYSRERYLRTEFEENMIQQESTFWRRSLWQKAGGRLRGDLKFAGDFELWVRFFRYTTLFTVDTILGGYRRHENQKAALFLDRYHAEARRIIDEEMALIRQRKFVELLPATAPISFSHQELKSYIDSMWSNQKHSIYKISDDTGIVIESLVKRLRDAHSPELQVTRAALDEIRNSLTWKMTAPFRHFSDVVKKLTSEDTKLTSECEKLSSERAELSKKLEDLDPHPPAAKGNWLGMRQLPQLHVDQGYDEEAVAQAIVAFEVGGVPEVARQDVNARLVPPGDASGLLQEIREFMRNPDIGFRPMVVKRFLRSLIRAVSHVPAVRKFARIVEEECSARAPSNPASETPSFPPSGSPIILQDTFIQWLMFANAGMLHGGNVYCFDHAIRNLPSEAPIVEIGSFCGLSTNALTYFKHKHGRRNQLVTADSWVFEGSTPGVSVGESTITHDAYREFVKETFRRNVEMFSRNDFPYTMEMFSDEFFEAWRKGIRVQDIFGRWIALGGPISFCYIDGNHTYDFAKRDFENVDTFLEPGGFIFFDDSEDGSGWGVCRVVEEVQSSSRYEIVIKNPNYLFRKK